MIRGVCHSLLLIFSLFFSFLLRFDRVERLESGGIGEKRGDVLIAIGLVGGSAPRQILRFSSDLQTWNEADVRGREYGGNLPEFTYITMWMYSLCDSLSFRYLVHSLPNLIADLGHVRDERSSIPSLLQSAHSPLFSHSSTLQLSTLSNLKRKEKKREK